MRKTVMMFNMETEEEIEVEFYKQIEKNDFYKVKDLSTGEQIIITLDMARRIVGVIEQ
jgi:hypothetical protein